MKSGFTGIAGIERQDRGMNMLVLSFCAFMLLFVTILPCSLSAAPLQGDRIINTVSVSSATAPVLKATASATIVIRTPSKIEYLQYAPSLPGIPAVQVVPGFYRSGSDPLSPLLPLPLPVSAGTSTPINLALPIPLVPILQLHQGEPLFIRVTDPDQNLDRTKVENIYITVTNPSNGDAEVLQLTETGPDTGAFIAYLPTVTSGSSVYNGSMSVSEGHLVSTRYVDVVDGSDTALTAILVDPFGIFFDSVTGQPIDGATISMVNIITGLPAAIFGDDGVSIYPSELVSGGGASDNSGRVYIFQPGGYRFPFVQPGNYRFEVKPPPGYSFPSKVETSVIQTLPGAPFAVVNGSRNEAFVINPGPALRIDIPLDPAPPSLWVQKSSGKDSVGHGDFVPYQISVTNTSKTVSAGGVQLNDVMPVGFRYRKGSLQINGQKAADPSVSSDGRTLKFMIGTMEKASVVTIDYVAEVTAGAAIGTAVNSAVATSAGVNSNVARASVTVRDDFLRTRSTLMGRVTTGICSEETGDGPDGVSGIRIYLEDGTFVVSDQRGLFHFEGVRSGLHVVQLDLDSLPDGYEAYPCTENSRFAGRAFSQFVETQGGTLWRTDFHIRPKSKPPVEVAAVAELSSVPVQIPVQPVKGEVAIELANAIEGQKISYRVNVRGKTLSVHDTHMKVLLPEGVLYEPGSSRMDGVSIADPVQYGNEILVYTIADKSDRWQHEFTFRGRPALDKDTSSLSTLAYLVVEGSKGARVLTPPAETTLQFVRDVEVQRVPEIVLHPHFPSFGDELGESDRHKLDELARLLIGLRTEKIHVTGHTDNVRIAPRSRNIHKDNLALSLARAKQVGRYLMDRLHFPPEKLSLDGKGENEPVASNRTEAGRALNRRVEVKITSSRIINRSQLTVLKAFSGEQQAETAGESPVEQIVVDKVRPGQEPPSVKHQMPGAQAAPALIVKSDSTGTVSAPVTATATVTPTPPSVTGTAVRVEPAIPRSTEQVVGFIGLKDGDLLVNRINAIQFILDSALTARLMVDGTEVPAKQLGFRRQDPASGKTQYGYIGVDFGPAGEHTLTMQGLDPFGNARAEKTVKLIRTGDIASIRLLSSEGNVADGKTPVRMRLELFDREGNPIRGAADLELRDGNLKPLVDDSQLLEEKVVSRRIKMDREGWISFQPVSVSGPYRVLVGYNTAVAELEAYVQPKLRDWILVGLAEGTMGYNTASGNMENLRGNGVEDELYKDGRIAFFAKGQLQGKWLLTMAYDSAKSRANSGDGLFSTINPDTYYTLYGDAGQQQYDAASAKKLYIKIEREQFYAMFGDYDTGLTITELSRYSRRMTGIKTELQTRDFEINAFASETEQSYIRDELPGDGTSGVYRLSRKNVLPNSEKITIEVRDRFRSEILVSSRTLGRFTEYSIDYDSGTVIFKEPVFSRDEKFNPVLIVAEYETRSKGGTDYTYGGRAGLKFLDQRLKLGGSYIHEGQGGRSSNLFGFDSIVKLGENTRLRAEFASSRYSAGIESRDGMGYLGELVHTRKKYDVRAYFREQESGFGLGQQPGSEAGTRKFGAEGAYRFSDNFSMNGNAYRQYNLVDGARRDVAEGKFGYNDKYYGASMGLLHANDRLGDGSSRKSNQLTAGAKILTLYERLTLTIDHAQSILSNSNSDFPTRTSLGAEFRVHKNLLLLAAQEFTWGKGATTQNTRVGVRTSPWYGATLNSSVERQFNENNERVFANVGLKQNWKISDAWKVDAGLDRSQTLANVQRYQFNSNMPPASGGNENFTALSTGATYQVKHLTWDNRMEFRLANSENRWGLMSGLVREGNGDWAWSGRAQLFQSSASTGIDTTKANLRFGLVFRPPRTNWIVLNRLDYYIDHQEGGSVSSSTSWKVINNLNANFRPRKYMQVSLQYGAKFVRDTIGGRSYGGFTDHIGFEARYDITKKWDVGIRGSLLHSWYGGRYAYSIGPSTGYNIADNAWLSLGYNIWGFEDSDFDSAAYTVQGPYVRLRMKFDQQSVKDAAGWINKQ